MKRYLILFLTVFVFLGASISPAKAITFESIQNQINNLFQQINQFQSQLNNFNNNTSASKAIKVVSPDGGEELEKGKVYTIKWKGGSEYSRITIDTIGSDGIAASDGIDAVIANDGSYEWSVPETIPSGKYKIKISVCPNNFTNVGCANVGSQYGSDISNGYFNIIDAIPIERSIRVGFPNGGEELEKGKVYTIKWKGGSEYSRITIDTIGSDGIAASDGIDAVIANDGSYEWSVPETIPSGKYKIKISVCPNNFTNVGCANVGSQYGSDISNGYFNIIDAIPIERSIRVGFPNGAEELEIGETYVIDWESIGNDKIEVISLVDYSDASYPVEYHLAYNQSTEILYSWTIDDSFKSGDKYKIKISASSNGEVIYDESDDYFTIIKPQRTCEDSDGGINLFEKGTVIRLVNGKEKTYTDACVNKNWVREYYCTKRDIKLSKFRRCENGCSDGKCNPEKTPARNFESKLKSISEEIAKILKEARSLLK